MPKVTIPNVGTVNFPDSMSSDDISKAAKKLFDESSGKKDASSFERMKGKGQTEFQRTAAKRLAGVQHDLAPADSGWNTAFKKPQRTQGLLTEQQALAKGAGMVASMVPFAVAAPFTAGTSLFAAAALSAGAGLAGGLAQKTVESSAGIVPKSEQDLYVSLGIDTGMGFFGEVVGRGIGYATKEVIPQLIERSAAKSEVGAKVINETLDATKDKLGATIRNFTSGSMTPVLPKQVVRGKYMVDIADAYGDTLKILKGKNKLVSGVTARELGGVSPKGQQILEMMHRDLIPKNGQISSMQQLEGVMNVREGVADLVAGKLPDTERRAFTHLLKRLDGKIDRALEVVGPEAKELYKKAEHLSDVKRTRDVAVGLAESAVKKMTQRAVVGATIGGTVAGGYGYRRGGVGGIAKGAAEGATAGAVAGLSTAAIPRVSSWVLERVLTHPAAAAEMKRAISFYVSGKEGEAAALATRAVITSGVRNELKSYVESLGKQQ